MAPAANGRRRQPLPPVVPIAPLIDIVFLLLIFFMLVTKFLNPTIDLSLPQSTTAQVNDEHSVVVAISQDGRLALDDIPIPWSELTDRLRSAQDDIRIVRVRADELTVHRDVVRAFDCIRAAGLTEIALEAERPEPGPEMPTPPSRPTPPSCPVIYGPRVHGFLDGHGWIFLALSLSVHIILVAVLHTPRQEPLAPRSEILISLREPSPPPEPEPPPEPAAEPEPATSPPSSVQPPLPPPVAPPVAAPVIGVPGEDPSAIQSGQTMPPLREPEPEAAPPPAPSVPPADPEPAPQPAPPAVDTSALLRDYAGGIKARVLAHKSYPRVAERLHHEGAVKVGFTVDAGGALSAVTIKSSSGFDELDQAAVAAVNAAAPFAAIPAELQRSSLDLSITLNFQLD